MMAASKPKKKEDCSISRPVNVFAQMMAASKLKKTEVSSGHVGVFAQMMATPKPKKAQIVEEKESMGEFVSVKWIDGSIYKGNIMKTGKQGYLIDFFVHYKGWNNKLDEWVSGPEKTSESASKQNEKESQNITPKNPHKRRILEWIKETNNDETGESPESEPKRKKPVLGVAPPKAEKKKKEFEGGELYEYEKIRLGNIREREEMFKQLGISEAKTKLSHSFIAVKRVFRVREILPPRNSLRQQNIDADTGLKIPEERFIKIEPREEHHKLPYETISCKETCRGEIEESIYFLNKVFSSIKTKTTSKYTSFGGDANECQKNLSNLTINPERVAKVVKDRIFSVAIHPMEDKVLAAAGGKWGGVGLWDVNDTGGVNNGVQLWTPHCSPVNCLTWDKFNASCLISTSYDGTVRATDIEKQEHALFYGDEGSTALQYRPASTGYTYYHNTIYHSQVGPNTFLVSKGSSGIVGMLDTRITNVKMAQEFQVFDRISPKTVDVHPVQDNYFICSNYKAGCFIFDIRKVEKKLMTPVSELRGHSRALSSAMFSPITGNRVATVADDNKIRVYDTSKLSGTVLPVSQVKHNNQTGTRLTTFKVSWHPKMDNLLFMGSMEWPRQIEAFRVGDEGLKLVTALRGEDLGSVCSAVAVHPSLDVVIGGNSSGSVHVFM